MEKTNLTEHSVAMTIQTTELGVELLSAALESIGAEKQEIVEARANVAQFLEANAKHWDFVEDGLLNSFNENPAVRVYVPETDYGMELRTAILAKVRELKEIDFGFDMGTLEISEERINNEDWATNWRKYFKPSPIGERLIICPTWEKENLDAGDRVVLYIDPGMVFGSGTHETTSLCLELLGEEIKGGEKIFDAGCGSGILSIGALLFGAKSALGCDIDPAAEHVAMENAAQNGIGDDQLKILIGDILEDEALQREVGTGYDVLCSNIIADVVCALGNQAPKIVRDGGLWIASGIIQDRRADVENAMTRAGFTVDKVLTKGEWVAVLGRKNVK